MQLGFRAAAVEAFNCVVAGSCPQLKRVHADVRPLWPFAEWNPLLGCLSPGAVDAAGLVLGALGALWLWARRSERALA